MFATLPAQFNAWRKRIGSGSDDSDKSEAGLKKQLSMSDVTEENNACHPHCDEQSSEDGPDSHESFDEIVIHLEPEEEGSGINEDNFRYSFYQYCAPDSAKDAIFDAWVKSTGWLDFFDPALFALPRARADVLPRFTSNCETYFHNYVIVSLLFVAFGVALDPLACIAIVIVFFAYAALYVIHNERPLCVGPLTVHEQGKFVTLLFVALVTFQLASSLRTLLALVCLASFLLSMHALLMISREERSSRHEARPTPSATLSASDAEVAYVEGDSIV
mmetsp:Transcript_14891/g.39891  ORF Transcript_14891/g.39891 Transcript_14891/m.39891 type:complete len:275 (+) Transcript_14891:140-964(+)